ncbi:putative zinc-binding peptidase [Lichenihabitans sp. PAMC28606]|uniref:zinc-binding metallopeptidase family protein n=1 Tax=Lichenihabitans sp. PAMC28606 TaxID=2880932 RepID=UPI001D0A95EE|nr:putative zinc-binding peptidase [Lichenihabitans sp. PAMC28606]UDL94700.1 putative zinc-binding peptidase [Lichenihabitans sp. PAMC28606]
MKLFECQMCGQALYFENTRCERCHHRLGYIASEQWLAALEQSADEAPLWHIGGQPNRQFRFCENAEQKACNWLIHADATERFCAACRHNHLIPDLALGQNLKHWRLMELAKHRLFYTLMELNLPLVTRVEDPKEGLGFNFLEDTDANKKIFTGHNDGMITINIAEADDAERERRRNTMHEPYRTLLGHFRHEIGHWYWDRLVRDAPAHHAFSIVFGDESPDYGKALKRHYKDGAPTDWRQRYVSAYATSHPWEDFAETFAHYLHIVDTLETASEFGIVVHPRHLTHADQLSTDIDFEPQFAKTVNALIDAWLPLTFAVNSLNRSMGQADFYPFVLSPTVVDKLGFIHDLVHGRIGYEAPTQEPMLQDRRPPADNAS